MTDDLISRLATDDPWEAPDQEMGDCVCHFCGSEHHPSRRIGQEQGLHFDDCVWVEAMRHLGRELGPRNGIYVPPEPKTCETCGVVTSYDHHGNISFDRNTDAHWAHIRAESKAYLTRPVADVLPVLRAARGQIKFVHAVDLSNIREPDND